MKIMVAALATACVIGAVASIAQGDGDPGSDVLVHQDLFVGPDAGLSIPQQARFGGLLKAAARSGFPIRVAIIARPSDLGAVTGLWRKPRAYARFLGLELSLAYKQRLLVVMPNGLGFNWPGHASTSAYRALANIPIGSAGGGLLGAAQSAVHKLAVADGVKLPAAASAAAWTRSAGSATSTTQAPSAGQATDNRVAIIAIVLVAVAAAALLVGGALRRRSVRGGQASASGPRRRLQPAGPRWLLSSVALVAVLLTGTIVALAQVGSGRGSKPSALAFNPFLDPGTPLSGAAPDFTLSDQFGQPVSLRSFRGKVVILAFNDSECTTVCPLTTTAMLDAKAMLGQAGSRVQLLGIDANPAATSLEDVWSYSELHGMLHAWHFLTGSLPQLRQVWKRYGVEAAVERGQITHTPALFVIGPQGRKAKVYITQMSYSAIGQLGQVLAHEASNLLPDHPRVRSKLSYTRVAPITPARAATLPRAGGGSVRLGPGKAAHLYVFFATWDQETSGLAGELDTLNGYASAASRLGLPALTAVDEGSVEPSSNTLSNFLRRLPRPLSYPVAVDRTGRVADGYEVLGAPWFVLTSPTGQILYYREVSTAGWPSPKVLIRYVRAALARVRGTAGASTVRQDLAGSPAPLATVHRQANRLLGAEPALAARIRALRGYPIVINAWASWCAPCRSEFDLFASASARYGRRVAFLGANTNDSPGDARTFLAQHPVSYPSYETTTTNLSDLAVVGGLPTTIYINPAGKVVFVHTGQYDAQGTLDQDISSYALGG
jgi:cytochrome oxidase Cu insertion factor (SCO1/SenC/PrrC family)/thiol-disulfide isomerase/thioredoxin